MFFIGVFGFGHKNKKIGELTFKCTGCLNDNFSLIEISKTFDIFFIPVFKFNREYIIICNKCKSIYKLKRGTLEKVLEKGRAEYEDIEKIILETKICPQCGSEVVQGYAYCPKCGKSLK